MKTFSPPYLLSVVALSVTLVACGPAEEAEDQPPLPATEPAAEEPSATSQELPDTTAEAVWAYLQAQDYQSWPMWPGTSELYEGTEPHGMLLTTYVNDAALRPLEAGEAGDVPAGGIVVKENYMPDGTLAAVTVMYKVEGYNAEHQDWWFLKRLADGTVEASGRVDGCQSCHVGAPGDDYLFTALPGDGSGSEAGGAG